MKHPFIFLLILSLTTPNLLAKSKTIDLSLVISGGVSLGAYEAGYNWALITLLRQMQKSNPQVNTELRSVAGASAGSINSLLSAMYWCQKESVPLKNSVNDNLFYETWVNLGIEDLSIDGEDPTNKSSLFTRRGLEKKGEKIIEHLKKPIFRENCEVPLGVTVTKATPIIEEIQGIKVKNQNFSVPLTFKEHHGEGIVVNKQLPPSTRFYLSIPDIEKDNHKLINLLFASGAFPGAFQQVKLDYIYKGERDSSYFIDGGLYDNVPLGLAIELNPKASIFLFMDPSNMRKEAKQDRKMVEEKEPIGFISSNLMPVFSSFGIMQSAKLYDAINQYFRNNQNRKLVLSSRYHPLTGGFLSHFGAFLDQNFRTYDYYVGVYDALFHAAKAFKKLYPEKFSHLSQIEIMNMLKTKLGIDSNPEALAAYTLFLETEFHGLKPKTTDRFSAIYNAFDLTKSDEERYGGEEFKHFLTKLDMHYINTQKKSFLASAKKDVNSWYKRPTRGIINRITTLENDKAEVEADGNTLATLSSLSAWAGSTFVKEKEGLEIFPLNVPQDKGKESYRTALRLLPGELASDLLNGGFSASYTAIYYNDMTLLNGFEAKAAYVASNDADDFARVDLDVFKEFDDFIKFGAGVSAFGNLEGSFYERDSAFGLNAYVDIVDIFRLSYVYRESDNEAIKKNYLYFGIENIPALIYWLSR